MTESKGKLDMEARESMLKTTSPPRDKYDFVYLNMVLHGITILLPWNLLITIAKEYFVDYKLVEIDDDGNKHPTVYALKFFSFIGFCSQLPNVLINFINVFVHMKSGYRSRIFAAFAIFGLTTFITMILAMVDTSKYVTAFFYATVVSIILLNTASGLYQNSFFGLVSTFPPQYTNAILLGNNLCGLIVTAIAILSQILSDSIVKFATVYFAAALLIIAASIFSYNMIPKSNFFAYYAVNDSNDPDVKQSINIREYKNVLRSTWVQCFNVFAVFFVTLAIFPSIMAQVQLWRADNSYDFFISRNFFTPITTFLLFNIFAVFGTFVANVVQWPSPRFLIFPVLLRFVLIPLMMYCNYRPETRTWPVLITNEYIYIALGIIMAFTSAYFGSLAMMYAPRLVDHTRAPIAGMMSGFFLVFGVFCGATSAFATSYIIDNLGPIQRLSN